METRTSRGAEAPPGEVGRAPLPTGPAFHALYGEALPRVYGYFLRRCGGDRTVAEDLTQETFLAVVRAAKDGVAVDDPMAWIFGVARHKLLDHYRASGRRRRLTRTLAGTEPHASLEWSDDDRSREQAVAALAEVAPRQRAALVLHYVDGLPVAEVAATLGKSVPACESLLMRGKRRFRTAFEEVSHD
jgi:RNA polymerase sigma-70 factor, ECF subfamily